VMWMLLYKAHYYPLTSWILVGYIYHKPENSATYKATERYLWGPILCNTWWFWCVGFFRQEIWCF
jgi:hypothetical protein